MPNSALLRFNGNFVFFSSKFSQNLHTILVACAKICSDLGVIPVQIYCLTSIGILIIKIRQYHNLLIFIVERPIHRKMSLYWDGPRKPQMKWQQNKNYINFEFLVNITYEICTWDQCAKGTPVVQGAIGLPHPGQWWFIASKARIRLCK